MPDFNAHLTIGYSGADQDGLVEIDDDEWEACQSDDEREALLSQYLMEWAGNYIEVWGEIIE